MQKGDIVKLNGRLAVIVGTEADDFVPEDHIGLWFGEEDSKEKKPIIWTVPAEYCQPAESPIIQH